MNNKQESKKILALVSDLMFTVKITEAAKRNGMSVDYVKTDDDLLMRAKENPQLIIIDLNMNGAEPVKTIEKLKSNPDSKNISILSYVSHIQGDLKMMAQEAGADVVMARSALSQNLIQILKRHSGNLIA